MYYNCIFVGVFCLCLFLVTEASRVLICVPCPSVSHQVLFYPLVKELAKRGHEVVFITTNPIYPKGQAPANLTEIDTHDAAYQVWKSHFLKKEEMSQGDKRRQYKIMSRAFPLVAKSFEMQMQTLEVQELIKKRTKFDVLIVEASSRPVQSLSYIFKAPMILMSSLGAMQDNYIAIGAPIYPKLLYPTFWHHKLNNLTIIDKIRVLWDSYNIEKCLETFRVEENNMIKRLFGPDTPPLEQLSNNIQMLFLNEYPLWGYNRPVPPGVVYIGGMHQTPRKKLPKDIKSYLDSSKLGVVYFSLGTNVSPSTMSAEKIRAIASGLARLNYDVLIKWDTDNLPGKGNNTRVASWFPQADLLQHPNIKAFVTQGGLQSFDEALTAGVPLVGIPMLGDQWFNVERYVALKIGVGITEQLTEDLLVHAVNTVIDDPSYRQNIIQLRDRLRDQPESALDRAVWWVEYVIRHKGASHLRAPAANMSWTDYIDVELIAAASLIALLILAAGIVTICLIIKYYFCNFKKLKNE